ncbi:type IV secretion system protein VirB11 [Phenylobacterium haematophilum]|jgi:type IV secretion system protein TrbB|uniref:Type IV secretion system protein VirB11 n=1 Tax=Phenylobacterium haematophilum TaxID=98513 RepID=A0A840A5T2_9CAUL|nr:P-type conjugative transfer ATPase TrbB [Phenylobacterium haematophilum]MBB3892831.1 type IV secretion system protein VirB11 [Phenylobacterium haematophilum]
MAVSHPIAQDRKVAALKQAMGPVIAAALADRMVVEVMVNPDGKIWVDRIGEGRSYTGQSLASADADRILRLLADHVGEVVTRDRPRVSATLPETGERFQGAFMPIVPSPAFAIRKRPEVVFTLDDYVEQAIMTASQAAAIRAAAVNRDNMLIVGGTGSGKTTLANAILAEPAFATDRVVLIEDTAELQCSAEDKVQMLTKRTEPVVTMTDLVRDTLRLRPDRIIIGEVRDGSALDLLKAWNTGHPGGLATIHANSAREGLTRLEDLIGEATPRIPYRAITQAINVVIFIERAPNGRRVREVSRLVRREGETYFLEPVRL